MTAIIKNPDATVTIMHIVYNPDVCASCRTCEAVCSLFHVGVISKGSARIRVHSMMWQDFETSVDVLSKCDTCGGEPQCVKFCPEAALKLQTFQIGDSRQVFKIGGVERG